MGDAVEFAERQFRAVVEVAQAGEEIDHVLFIGGMRVSVDYTEEDQGSSNPVGSFFVVHGLVPFVTGCRR